MNQMIFRKLLKISSVTFKITSINYKLESSVFDGLCTACIFWCRYFYLIVEQAGITTRELDTSTKQET